MRGDMEWEYKEVVERLGKTVELVGVAIIVVGLIVSIWRFAGTVRSGQFASYYTEFRRSLARSILLGLEFLVAGDIISTVAVEYQRPSAMSLPRVSVLPAALNSVEFLLPTFVVDVPFQVSPPAIRILPLPGRMTIELQKTSVSVRFSRVRCGPDRPSSGSQTS